MSATPTELNCHPGGDTLPARIVVLCIGNLLWADEGFGVRCIEHGTLIQQIELLPGARDDIGIPLGLQVAHDGGTHHSPVPGNVNAGVRTKD